MAISLNRRGWPRRRLRGCSRLPTLASNLQAVESEIAAGRIALFSPNRIEPAWEWFLLLSRRSVPIWTVNADESTLPWLSPGTLALCSSDFPLAPRKAPATILYSLSCNSHVNVRWIVSDPVPRGRFELPRGYPHYALNVARLPVPPHRQDVSSLVAGSRPADSNRRPAVYETAALPTELGRHTLHLGAGEV